MKTRIVSGLIMLPLLGVLFLGGYYLMTFVFVITLACIHEFFKAFNSAKVHPSQPITFVTTIALYILYLLFPNDGTYLLLWVVLTTFISCIYMFDIEKRRLEDSMAMIMANSYIVLFAFHLILISQHADFSIMIWIVVFASFGSDTMAYFVGVTIGRHKLCPTLSPKKSIEGAIGGVFGSLLFCGLFGYFIAPYYLIHCLVLGIIGGAFAQLGDLTASAIKRKLEIKDYGALIPGHGGVLDRVDSIIFNAPLVYYYMFIVTNL